MTSSLNPVEQTYRQLVKEGRSPIKLYSGNPADAGIFFPKEILERCYRDYFSRLNYAPHPKGLLTAREAIARYYDEEGVSVNPDNILITSGSSESFLHLFSLLTEPGDNILTPNPSYPLFDDIARMQHIDLRPYDLQEDQQWSVDLEHLKRQTDARTKAIAIVSPHNPTGSVVSAEQIGEIVSWANQKGIALICDQVFAAFYFGEALFPRPMTVAQPDLCFTLNGISKMFALPGLKLSWIAVSGRKDKVAEATERLETLNDTFLTCHIPIQEALPALFDAGLPFLKEYQHIARRNRDTAIQVLSSSPHLSLNSPQGGFYLMAKVDHPKFRDEESFVIRLMKEKGVFVHPGYFYDYEVGVHFVMSYLSEEQSLRAGLDRLKSFLAA